MRQAEKFTHSTQIHIEDTCRQRGVLGGESIQRQNDVQTVPSGFTTSHSIQSWRETL